MRLLYRSILLFVTKAIFPRVPITVSNFSTAALRSSMSTAKYTIEEFGSLYDLDYRVYFKDQNGSYISPWHDIPLFVNESKKIYNMVIEIPRWTNAKMEISTKESMTPIKQDVKNGKPRFVDNFFPFKGYIWNYGALPQTSNYGANGDNDPIDVIEIGSKIHRRGDVISVKVVGVIGLIDEGETDWKLVAIDVTDEKADEVSEIKDVEKHFPGLLKATREWFRNYKIPTGKSANQFAFNGLFKDADFAHDIISQTHEFWKRLIKEPSPELNTEMKNDVDGAAHVANSDMWKNDLLIPMDEDLETSDDADKFDNSNGEKNELQYHEAAQQLCEEINKLTMEICEGDERNDDLRSQRYLQQADNLEEDFAKTQSCRYMMTDAKLMKSLSKLIAAEIHGFQKDSAEGNNYYAFFRSNIENFLKNECGLIEVDGKTTLDNQQSSWATFGNLFMNNILSLPPALSCLGPLLLDEIPKEMDDQFKKLKKKTEKKEEELQRRTDPLAKQLDHVMHCLKSCLKQRNTKSINYFEFCFHPTDFSRSVANAFYTSFLLKENKVGLDIGDDNMPCLSLISNAERKSLEDSADQDNRAVISFSYKDWQEIVTVLDIRNSIITDY
ncbi:Inorganic pyrophosphatase 2, mitochondrial [Dirofilaria immitis]|nr:Inorganic pyrophosphatase 2, mitochondrial [Dirofilaria immitis]